MFRGRTTAIALLLGLALALQSSHGSQAAIQEPEGRGQDEKTGEEEGKKQEKERLPTFDPTKDKESEQSEEEKEKKAAKGPRAAALKIVEKAIQATGGREAWEAIGDLSYRQTFTQYAPASGKPFFESEYAYVFAFDAAPPKFRGRREDHTEGEGVNFNVIGYDGRVGWMTVEGSLIRSLDRAQRSEIELREEAFMAMIPYSLTWDDVALSYLGPTVFQRKPVREIEVVIQSGFGKPYGKDRMLFYFDPESGMPVGMRNLLEARGAARDTVVATSFEKLEEAGGVTFCAIRRYTMKKGRGVDDMSGALPVRTMISRNIQVNSSVDAGVFKVPR